MTVERELPQVGRTDDELRSDCLRLVAHDLNNPLTAIRILAEMLRDEIPDSEMRQDMIDILEAADLAGALMDGMASLVRLEGKEEDYTWFPIDLVELLRRAVDRPALRRHIRLELPREIQMGGDRLALHRAFTDVLINARRLSDGWLPISVVATSTTTSVEVRVRHPGPEIPQAVRERLFEMFGAVELRESRIPVSAVGLVFARTVIDGHGGTIGFEDCAEGGMDLVIRLKR
jgi:two-component system, OmpR family, sensor histidine kinase KdpD